MTIVSWNVCFRNADFDEAFQWIASLECDLLCLQEVPEQLLARLRKLPYALAVGVDVDRLFPGGMERNYLVILSKHPIRATGSLAFPLPRPPWRTRLLVRLLRRQGWSRIDSRTALWADVAMPGRTVRIANLHLLLAYPSVRAAEFERVMQTLGEGERLVCGDFNILEYPKATIINWLCGGPLIDAFRFTHERRDMERRFAGYGLINPLRGQATHVYSNRQQLSHILVRRDARVVQASVSPERHGSDHHPVRLDLTG